MATTEERDVPELDELLTEIEQKVADLDARPAGTLDAVTEIKETVLPLLKDVVAAVIFAVDDLNDLIDPVKLPRADAQEIGTLLGALHAHAAAIGDQGLQQRINDVLPLLVEDEEAEGDAEDES